MSLTAKSQKLRRSLSALSAMLAIGLSTPAMAGREDQWVFRRELGDGSHEATAMFLSWNYSAVVFRAKCDESSQELVIEYPGDGEVHLTARDTMTLSKKTSVRLRTQLVEGVLEGRAKITPELLRLLSEPGELDIEAPNAMDEPWHVGVAEPLLRLAKLCR